MIVIGLLQRHTHIFLVFVDEKLVEITERGIAMERIILGYDDAAKLWDFMDDLKLQLENESRQDDADESIFRDIKEVKRLKECLIDGGLRDAGFAYE